MSDIVERARELRRTIEGLAEDHLTDAEGLENVELFPWYEVGVDYAVGDRFQYDGELYKVLQAHTSQQSWVPGTGTESLYVKVDDIHAGTAEDPIPYNGNMELIENLYYTQDGVLYRCTKTCTTHRAAYSTDVPEAPERRSTTPCLNWSGFMLRL